MTSTRHSLDSVRSDGWFIQLLNESPSLARAAQVVGPEVLALSMIAGTRIEAVEASAGGAITVRFSERGGAAPLEAPLADFAARVASACLRIVEDDPPLGESPSEDELRRAVGARTLLTAPLYEIELLALVDDDDGRRVELRVADTVERVSLEDLRALLRARVESLASARAEPESALSMERFERADEAHRRGEHEAVVGLLGPLVGPLAGLSRRPEARSLSEEQRLGIGRGIRQLGLSLSSLERVEEAEAVLRLAIQWSRDDVEARASYAALGEISMAGGSDGQAIAYFRRALALGAGLDEVAPPLALALARRDRAVPTLGIARAARAAGVSDPRLDEAERLARSKVGHAFGAFERLVTEGFGDSRGDADEPHFH